MDAVVVAAAVAENIENQEQQRYVTVEPDTDPESGLEEEESSEEYALRRTEMTWWRFPSFDQIRRRYYSRGLVANYEVDEETAARLWWWLAPVIASLVVIILSVAVLILVFWTQYRLAARADL